MNSRTQEMLEWLVDNGYTPEIKPEAVLRFIDGTMKNEHVCYEDALQVAALMAALMDGVRKGDDINVQLRQILHLRKNRVRMCDPKTVYPGSPAWKIVEQYVRKQISYKKAGELFKKEVYPAETRTIQGWIAEIKPRVQEAVERLDRNKGWQKRLVLDDDVIMFDEDMQENGG